jgi:putative flippase GtrA
MYTFLKAQLSSFLSSLADYCCMVLAVEFFGWWYVLGSSLGTITGGLVNFSLGRSWVFDPGNKAAAIQLFRYILVWIGYFLLVTSGVYLFTHFFHVNYLISKVSVTLMLGISYNYPLQKVFVFK